MDINTSEFRDFLLWFGKNDQFRLAIRQQVIADVIENQGLSSKGLAILNGEMNRLYNRVVVGDSFLEKENQWLLERVKAETIPETSTKQSFLSQGLNEIQIESDSYTSHVKTVNAYQLQKAETTEKAEDADQVAAIKASL